MLIYTIIDKYIILKLYFMFFISLFILNNDNYYNYSIHSLHHQFEKAVALPISIKNKCIHNSTLTFSCSFFVKWENNGSCSLNAAFAKN